MSIRGGQTSILSSHVVYFIAGHTNGVRSVAWSPDGLVLASGSSDQALRLWSAQTGELLQILEGHTDTVNNVAWSPDGLVLASASDDQALRLWNAQTGELLRILENHTAGVNSVAWSPDGLVLASGSNDGTVRLWNAQTGESQRILKGHTPGVNSVAWSPDGLVLASASDDGTVRLWNAQTGEPQRILKGHTAGVNSVAWSPDGLVLASASDDQAVRLWNAQTGELLRILENHTSGVKSVAWSPNGQVVASGSSDHTVRLWDGKISTILLSYAHHANVVKSVAWSPDGLVLASGSDDETVRLWNAQTGELLRILEGHTDTVYSVAWSPDGLVLASGSKDESVRLWNAQTGELLRILESEANSVAWSPDGLVLASGNSDGTVRLWNAQTGKLLRILEGHADRIWSLAWSPDGLVLASGAADRTVRLWNAQMGSLLSTLEGHTNEVNSVAWSPDGKIFISQSDDSICLWRPKLWEMIEIVEGITSPNSWDSLYFSPHLPQLAAICKSNTAVQVWDVDVEAFLAAPPLVTAVNYTTAKIALVGESSVGKSGLGYRLAEDRFQVTESTHGQQFWVVNGLGTTRDDGTLCEAILWDFAGQANFRPIHSLFLEDVELALILFDPSRPETLAGVDYWLKQLAHQERPCQTVLVAARADVSKMTQSTAEIEAFCHERNISGGFIETSAKDRTGIDTLIERIQQQIDWDAKPTTITTSTFKRVKDYVLSLKTDAGRKQILVSRTTLQEMLRESDPNWRFSDAELIGAVAHLQNHGYVTILRRSSNEQSILLMPDVLINLASRYMHRAGANEKGLGALDEALVLSNGYRFEEVERLDGEERDTLLNAVTELFLRRNICFRESIDNRTFLIFPSLILERPPKLVENVELVEDMTYLVGGQVENVYAALVVLLGYSPTFQRVNQWRRQAQYETVHGEICGFKLANDDATELELVLYYDKATPEYVRMRFQGLFEEILHSRPVTIKKYLPLICSTCKTQQTRSTVMDFIDRGETFLYCVKDGKKLRLPKTSVRTTLSKENRTAVARDKVLIGMRTSYETALSSIKRYMLERRKLAVPSCFISYASGDRSQERWVVNLAKDLQKADLTVILDKWDNTTIGTNLARFIERMEQCDYVLVVGTLAYRQKYENTVSSEGNTVAAEMDLINRRLLRTESQKESILPLLLEGKVDTAFPPFLRARVYADFTHEEGYFAALFDLLLTIYSIPFNDVLVRDMKEMLQDERDAFLSKKARK